MPPTQWEATPGRLDRRAVRALLVYYAGATAYLGWLMALDGARGLLLVPVIALHAVLAAILARTVMPWKPLERNA